jgi:signal transduction histidine kinase
MTLSPDRDVAADARQEHADTREANADVRDESADAREVAADARDVAAADDLRDVERLRRDLEARGVIADLRLAEANVALQSAKEHLNAAAAQEAAAEHKTEDAERLKSFADEQLVTAAAKLAEATSDSEEYQRALYHYTQLVRHRMANPLHIIGGAAATLQARPDMPETERIVLLNEIYRQAKVLERVCLEPKIMSPSENGLEPAPAR